MSLEQDSGSERLGELSLPDIFPVSLPSIISSPHATKKKIFPEQRFLHSYLPVFTFTWVSPWEGDILLCSVLKTKTNKKQKHNDLSKGLWAASGVEGDSSGQPFREGRPVQKHS